MKFDLPVPRFLTQAAEKDLGMANGDTRHDDDRREVATFAPKRTENNLPDRVASLEAAWRGLNDAMKNAEDDITDLRAHRAVVEVSSLARTVGQKSISPLRDIAALTKDLNYGDIIEWAEVLVKDLGADGASSDRVASILFKWAKKAAAE